MSYSIEYKSTGYPYNYKYLLSSNDYIVDYDSIKSARARAVSLIKGYTAIVCVIRGNGRECLVYGTKYGGFVCENRKKGQKSKWYIQYANGTISKSAVNVDVNDLVRSAWD